MFETFRYNLKHNRRGVLKAATAWFLFGAIIVVFIFWGMSPRTMGTQLAEGGAAAVVNNSTISLAQFGETMERMRQDPRFEQLQALGGDMGRQIMQSQALNQLIQIELIHQQADSQGIVTTDAEVRDIITGIPQFQENGKFQRDRYMGYLQGTRKTAAAFEDEIRKQQAIQRSVKMFGSALRPIPQELEMQKALSDRKAALEFASVPTDALVTAEKVPGSEVDAFVADAANAGKLKDYYESHKDAYSQEEQVHARHILIKAAAGNAEEEKKAQAKVQDIAARAKKEDFGKLAKEFSEDPGSKEKGGDLGFFQRGRMVKPFEDAAFSGKPNEISAPIKTDYGYHLVQVLEKKPAQTRSLDEVKKEIAGILIAQEKSKKEFETLQQLVKSGDQAAVNKFLTEHKIKWDETGSFSIDTESVPKIGPSEDAVRVAFTLTPEKPLAPEIIRQGAMAFVLRYKAPEAPKKEAAKPEEKPEIMAELAASRRGEDALGQWIKKLEKTATITVNPKVQGAGPSAE
jgi:peptidyl-prolyl cis-trans isomerase D